MVNYLVKFAAIRSPRVFSMQGNNITSLYPGLTPKNVYHNNMDDDNNVELAGSFLQERRCLKWQIRKKINIDVQVHQKFNSISNPH